MSYTCVNRPDRRADVLMTLHESGGWMSNKEIAAEVSSTQQTIRTVTRRLVDSGQIESMPDVRYPRRKVFKVK